MRPMSLVPTVLAAVVLTLAAPTAARACLDGEAESAYDLGHTLAFRGIDTHAAREVAPHLGTCFAIGYREGRLQRLLRTSQPHPPRAGLVRPRRTDRG